MKAVCVHKFGGPEVLKVEEREEPKPGPGQLLIRVKNAGVNPVDLFFRSGVYPASKKLKLPWIPGYDAAGEVIAVGEGVSKFKVGDRIFGMTATGSYAENALLNEKTTAILPSHLSFEEGASLPVVLYTAFYALVYRGKIQPGQTVLIQGGAGGVGSMAIQLAKACGAKVLTTVSTKEKGEFCRKIGADVTIFYRDESFSERCLQETDGRGVDVLIETVASENFEEDSAALKLFGRLVLIGAGTGKSLSANVNFTNLYAKNIEVRGMSLFNAEEKFPDMVRQVGYLLQNRKIQPIIGEKLPLKEAAASHELLESSKVIGKIVLEV